MPPCRLITKRYQSLIYPCILHRGTPSLRSALRPTQMYLSTLVYMSSSVHKNVNKLLCLGKEQKPMNVVTG